LVSFITGQPTAPRARAVAWFALLSSGASSRAGASNGPWYFQTELLNMRCLVTSEEQPVRDVVRLMLAVMLVLVVGCGSRHFGSQPVTVLGRLVGQLGVANFNRTTTTPTPTTRLCNASLKACMTGGNMSLVRHVVRIGLGDCHAIELKWLQISTPRLTSQGTVRAAGKRRPPGR
jgi:hypothetical protein